jgi:hypothetical protein
VSRKVVAKTDKKNNMPFSKKNIVYARLEAYIFSAIIIVLVLMDKDVSSVAGVLLSLSWAGYKSLQCFYIWMCKHEHLMDKKIEYKKLGLDPSDLDVEISDLENQEIESEE